MDAERPPDPRVTRARSALGPLLLCAALAAVAAPAAAAPEAIAAPASAAPAEPRPPHDRAFWRAIAAADYAVPAGASAADLVLELSDYLGATDPELRDTFAYEIPAAWIHRDRLLDATALRRLLDRWRGNLAAGIGESGTESVLLRSFSALDLSLLAALDNSRPFLGPAEFDGLLSAALDYLAREKDVRGWVEGSGWHHSVAHTADLIKFLARSPKLGVADQKRILAAMALKIDATPVVLVWGEDDRLAAAVLSLLRRDDGDMAAFVAWVDRLAASWPQAWNGADGFDAARYVVARNARNVLTALHLQATLAPPFPARDRALAALQAALGRM